jgi:hypothetical protein
MQFPLPRLIAHHSTYSLTTIMVVQLNVEPDMLALLSSVQDVLNSSLGLETSCSDSGFFFYFPQPFQTNVRIIS